MFRLVLFLFFFLINNAAHAEIFNTGNDLYEALKTTKLVGDGSPKTVTDVLIFGQVMGYLDGYTGSYLLYKIARDRPHVFDFCMPKDVTKAQVVDVFYKYLTDHPEQRHLPSANITAIIFRLSFPCNH